MKSRAYKLPEIIADKLDAIRQLCHRYHIKYLWVFGSVLTEEFREGSDIDFLYELDRAVIAEGEYLPNLDGLIAGILNLFPNRKVDLVHYPSLRNPYFIEEVEETKVLLYDKNRKEVAL